MKIIFSYTLENVLSLMEIYIIMLFKNILFYIEFDKIRQWLLLEKWVSELGFIK